MSKKDRRTYQPIAGELVDYLERTQGARGVQLVINASGEHAFIWEALIRDGKHYVPCRMPVWMFERWEGVHEWHMTTSEPQEPQRTLF